MSKLEYDLDQLKADLVSAYNWFDEARDYEECDDEGREGHVFNPLQRLAKFCGYRR